jgi:malonyl-CoA decarboxylase
MSAGADCANVSSLVYIVQLLRSEFPSLETFVTLSPIPRFRKWLEDKLRENVEKGRFYDGSLLSEEDITNLFQTGLVQNDRTNPWKALLEILQTMDFEDEEQQNVIRPILLKLASRYLVLEKHRGKPLDGVCRFHVTNGAQVHRLNFPADVSRKGIQSSFGMMVNYQYEMDKVQENQQCFERHYYRIPVHPQVLKWVPSNTSSKL